MLLIFILKFMSKSNTVDRILVYSECNQHSSEDPRSDESEITINVMIVFRFCVFFIATILDNILLLACFFNKMEFLCIT